MATQKGTTRPNIVFILCDNVGWGDFSCYGGNTPTPRIDRLASGGSLQMQDVLHAVGQLEFAFGDELMDRDGR